jgi:hypothetical protein
MTTFTSYGGINLNYDVLGGPGEAVVCLPCGPLRAPRYLGDLGGLDAYRKLVVLELPPKRVDRIVADLEALRTHLGQDRLDLLVHSAAGCNTPLPTPTASASSRSSRRAPVPSGSNHRRTTGTPRLAGGRTSRGTPTR